MNYEKNEDDDDEYDDDELYKKPIIKREIKTDTLGNPNMMLLQNKEWDRLRRYEKDQNYLDFGLYLISGILLIFILEQFVQLGMIMKDKRVNEKLYVF